MAECRAQEEDSLGLCIGSKGCQADRKKREEEGGARQQEAEKEQKQEEKVRMSSEGL